MYEALSYFEFLQAHGTVNSFICHTGHYEMVSFVSWCLIKLSIFSLFEHMIQIVEFIWLLKSDK